MGRGRSSSGGGRGASRSSSRGMSRSSFNKRRMGGHGYTTVIIGGGHHGYHAQAGFGTLIFMAVIFIMFGVGFSIFGINIAVESKRYGSVEAVCVDNDLIQGWYYTTYDYTVNGVNYTNMSQEGWEIDETLGEIVTIYYLKSDPNVITENKPNGSVGAGILVTLFSLVFVGVGALLIVTAVKTKKNATQASVQPPQPLKPIEETKNKCLYCGSKYDKNLTSCPQCGASRVE